MSAIATSLVRPLCSASSSLETAQSAKKLFERLLFRRTRFRGTSSLPFLKLLRPVLSSHGGLILLTSAFVLLLFLSSGRWVLDIAWDEFRKGERRSQQGGLHFLQERRVLRGPHTLGRE